MQIAGSVSKRYLFIEALLILSLSYLLLLDAGNQSLSVYPVNLFSAILFTLITLTWLFFGQKAGNPMVLPAAIWMIVSLISTIFSIDPRRSLSELILSSITIFLFFLVFDLVQWKWPPELFIKCLLIVGAIAMVFSWIGVIDFYTRWWAISDGKLLPPVAFRLSAPNVQAWNLNPLVMLALARLLFTRSKIARWGLGVYILSGLVLIFFSSSRAGWIGTAAGFVVLGYVYCVTHHITFRSIWIRVKAKRGLTFLTILSGAVVLAGAGYVLYRQTIHPTHASLIDSRLVFWSTAIKTIGQNLVIGQGPFTFVSAYVNDHSVPYYGVYMHAHSLPLTITSETGLLGLAASLILLVTAMVLLWKRFSHSQPESLPVIAGALAVLSTASIHSLFDSFIGKSLGSWVIVIVVAAALSIPAKSEERSTRPWFALIVVLALWVVVWVSYPMASAQEHAVNNEWQLAIQNYREAVRRDAFSAASYQQLALAESVAGDDLNLAIKTFKETIRLDPSWALNHSNLGALYLAQSDDQNAKKEFKIAADKSPDSYLYSLNYGLAAEIGGDTLSAADAYKNVLRVMPDLATSSFWQGTDFRKRFIAGWLNVQPVTPVLAREELEIYARNYPYDTRYYNELAMLEIKDGNFDRAQYWIDLAGLVGTDSIYPRVETVWMQVELAAALGDINKAVELGRITFQRFVSPGTSGPGDSEGSYYTGSAFRTPVMNISLVPQMVTPMPAVWEQRFLRLNDWIVQTQGEDGSILPELLRLAHYLKISEK